MRRVEKIVQTTKSTKEDVMKSQVYLQFIRNMENEVRRFEETEQPSTVGKYQQQQHSNSLYDLKLNFLSSSVDKY